MKYFLIFFIFFSTINFAKSINENAKIKIVFFNGKIENYDYNSFKKINYNQVTIKQIELQIDIPKNFDSHYLILKTEVPRIYFYANNNCVAQTGYAINRKKLSILNNNNVVNAAKFKDFSRITIVVPRHRYKLFFPEMYFSNVLPKTDNNNLMIMFDIGFNLALSFFSVFWLILIKLKNQNLQKFYKALFVTTFLSIFNFAFRANLLEIDSLNLPMINNYFIYNLLGCLDPFLYYLLYYYFFDLKNNKIIDRLLVFSFGFWVLLAVLENTKFESHFLSEFCIIYMNCAAIFDFLVLIVFAVVVVFKRFKGIENKIVFTGLLMMLLSAFEIAQVRFVNLLNLEFSWVRLSGFSELFFHYSTTINITTLIIGTIYIVKKIQVENYALDQQIIETEKQHQKNLNTTIVQTQEQVLQNISQELHDDAGQQLTVINFQLENLKLDSNQFDLALSPISESVIALSRSIRNISHSLNNQLLSQQNLIKAIETEIDRLKENKSIQINFVCDKQNDKQFSTNEKIVLYRIFQETINNILKHAKATIINIEIKSNSKLEIKITDNGKGFDIHSIKNQKQSVGLQNIINRAKIINYHAEINSEIGVGTTVCLIEK